MISIIIRAILITIIFEVGCYFGERSTDSYTPFEKRKEIKKIGQAVGTALVVVAALIP